ncbi:hypothetical protein GGR57DRAFT_319390 [Xylariaceae sp. FL1272]|nr:hypothetical protein GGR57DRAFT_319390 [Xylariaceae sp. FL1272]
MKTFYQAGKSLIALLNPVAMTLRRNWKCECQCRGTGRLPVCKDGRKGKADPKHKLCDLCYYEVKQVNTHRHNPTCQYPVKEKHHLQKLLFAASDNKAAKQEPKNPVLDSSSNTVLDSSSFKSE